MLNTRLNGYSNLGGGICRHNAGELQRSKYHSIVWWVMNQRKSPTHSVVKHHHSSRAVAVYDMTMARIGWQSRAAIQNIGTLSAKVLIGQAIRTKSLHGSFGLMAVIKYGMGLAGIFLLRVLVIRLAAPLDDLGHQVMRLALIYTLAQPLLRHLTSHHAEETVMQYFGATGTDERDGHFYQRPSIRCPCRRTKA